MKQEQLKTLQLHQLEILQEIDYLCKKHHINYYISWGTLLGAVRHKGFIPWDDDIDISLFWDDYEKFIKVCQTELSDRFFLQTVENDEGYFRTWAKVRINNTTSMDKNLDFIKMHWGICIDVFPIIQQPSNQFACLYQKILTQLYQILCFEPLIKGMFKDNKRINLFHRILLVIPYSVFTVIPRKIKESLRQSLINKIVKLQDKGSNLCGEILSMNYDKAIVPVDLYGKPTPIEFEGQYFMGPSNPCEYLTHFYGDFMKLPDESERVGHGDTIIDFNYQAHK